MTKSFPTLFRCLIAIVISALFACTTQTIKKKSAFDFSQTGQIELQISGAETEGVRKQVIKNLNDWSYPVVQDSGKTVSHRLKATVGQVENAKTPSGLSFSMGNSDPRALNFQKTDVLPIRCELTSVAHPEQSSEFSMGFANSSSGKQAAADKLADHISTVCFTLLREVKWPLPVQASQPTMQKSSWVPKIRIETKEVPVVPVKKTEALKQEAKVAGKEDLKKADSVTVETKTEEVNVSGETETKKQIIIHNEGSPIIFEMGHQRR